MGGLDLPTGGTDQFMRISNSAPKATGRLNHVSEEPKRERTPKKAEKSKVRHEGRTQNAIRPG